MVGAACAAPAASAHDVVWYIGSFDTLPTEQCWDYVSQNVDVEPVMEDGMAHLGQTTLSGKAYWVRPLTPFLASDGASISVNATILNSSYLQAGSIRRSGFSITMTDDQGRWARLGVSNSRLVLQTTPNLWGDVVLGVPLTDNAHDFRLEFFAGMASVRLDGELVLSSTAGYYGAQPNTVLIGDTTTWGHSESYLSIAMIETVPLCGGGDFNCDGHINAADLAVILANWGGSDCASDLDFDGIVGAGDLAIMLSAWTQ